MALKTLGAVGLAAAALVGSTLMSVQQAEAGPGWRSGGFRGAGYYRGGAWGGPRHYGYRRGPGWGYAGVGIASGLALGALAASTAPYYYGGYGAYGYPAYGYGGGCVIQRRQVWTPYGWRFRPVQVCY